MNFVQERSFHNIYCLSCYIHIHYEFHSWFTILDHFNSLFRSRPCTTKSKKTNPSRNKFTRSCSLSLFQKDLSFVPFRAAGPDMTALPVAALLAFHLLLLADLLVLWHVRHVLVWLLPGSSVLVVLKCI